MSKTVQGPVLDVPVATWMLWPFPPVAKAYPVVYVSLVIYISKQGRYGEVEGKVR